MVGPGAVVDPALYAEYESDVVFLPKTDFAPSFGCKKMEAIDMDDVAAISGLRSLRNKVAHEIPAMIASENELIPREALTVISHYVRKIDNFWGRNELEVLLKPELNSQQSTWTLSCRAV